MLLLIALSALVMYMMSYVVEMYRTYYFYKNQPKMKSVGFPLPFIGNLIKVLKVRGKAD